MFAAAAPQIPIFGLVDYDPDGLSILSTYKHGSLALAHLNATLNVPRMQWLGVRSADIGRVSDGYDLHQSQGLLPLTARDRRKAVSMLNWAVLAEDGREPEWRQELQVMLMLNVKAELQLLEAAQGGIVKWVTDRICSI